jgi:hypothetical protein
MRENAWRKVVLNLNKLIVVEISFQRAVLLILETRPPETVWNILSTYYLKEKVLSEGCNVRECSSSHSYSIVFGTADATFGTYDKMA